jgi:hypothetical protein
VQPSSTVVPEQLVAVTAAVAVVVAQEQAAQVVTLA